MKVRSRHGRWTDRFGLYIRHGSRKNFEAFLDHVENKGEQPSNVILDLVEAYIKSEKQIKEISEETGNIERE